MVSNDNGVKTTDQIILENEKLIKFVIKKMQLVWKTNDEFQEYYDNGLLGLISGAKEYDESKGKPSTFLCRCIANMIKRGIYLNHMSKRFNPHGRDASLNSIVNEDDEKVTEFGDLIADSTINIEQEIEKKLEKEKLLSAVDKLKDEVDKLAVKMYFGLEGYQPSTYEKIGEKFGFSRERARQRITRTLPKIKEIFEREKEVFTLKESIEIKSKFLSKEESFTNNLSDLNKVLFAQIDALNAANDNDVEFEKQIRKSYAISQISQQIVANTNTCIKALKFAKEQNIADQNQLHFIGIGNAK